ncbi:MAG TPA: hypothetical protein DIC52_13195 [Candidatus Latescibacteria bacterium]|nr:hypothetical protein [Candidatus Latescibacterota bacterium]
MTAELQLLAADEFETAARTDLPLCFRSILVIVSAEKVVDALLFVTHLFRSIGVFIVSTQLLPFAKKIQ